MSKKNIVKEDSEFRYLEEHFEEMMEEMKKDKLTQDFQISQEWDQKFRKTIDETLEELRKKSRRRKIKNAVIAAGVILAATACVDYSMVAVQGEGLLDIVESVFDSGEKNIITFGTEAEEDMEEEDESEIYFETSSLEIAYEQIRQELRMPMFYISYVPEGYRLEEARYDRAYRILNLKFENGEKQIYISQQQISDVKSMGIVVSDEDSNLIVNQTLNCEVPVYHSEQDDAYVFAIEQGTLILNGRISEDLNECEKLIKSICFK